jgi:putative colanic acid biosynthesis acetyltransferase WcaF
VTQTDATLAAASAPRALNRQPSPYGLREKVARLLWGAVEGTVFRFSFHTWSRWRVALINLFGGNVDPTCVVRRTAHIECPWNLTMGEDSLVGDRAILYCLGRVTIGRRVTLSQGAHVCAGSHDYTQMSFPLLRLPIEIEDDVWIAADAFVGPKVRVGEGAILGARGCTLRDLEPWWIYVGNPARKQRPRPRWTESPPRADRTSEE